MEPVHYNDQEYRQILQELQQLTKAAEQLPYPQAKDLIFSILQYFDLLHREALARLMKKIERDHPELRSALDNDFATKTMFGLYDMMELETGESQTDDRQSMGFVPESEVGLLNPVPIINWMSGGRIDNLQENKLQARKMGDENILLAMANGQIYAVKNACIDSMLPLEVGHLEGHFLICPWHGCRYDLSTGDLTDQPGEKLKTYDVKVGKDGNLMIGVPASRRVGE